MGTGRVIQPAHDGHEPDDQAAVVHRVGRDGRGGGEEGEDEDDEEIDAGGRVDDGSERLPDPPGPPYEVPGAAGEVGVA